SDTNTFHKYLPPNVEGEISAVLYKSLPSGRQWPMLLDAPTLQMKRFNLQEQDSRSAQYLDTLSPPLLGTQMLTPSKATPAGYIPAVNVPIVTPSAARILERVLLNAFATQILLPSKATPSAFAPVANVP